MADTPAATAPAEVPAEQQDGNVNEHRLFVGSLDFKVTNEHLREFFAPVESDILSCEVVQYGRGSAGYGFVTVSTEEAAKKAIETLDGQVLKLEGQENGRKVIVAPAKSAAEKEKERSERKVKRRSGRRGSKPVPGEVTEAEANGEAEKTATAADIEGENKPKKKKKKSNAKKFKSKAKAVTGENGAPAEAAEGSAPAEGESEKKKPAKIKRVPKPRRAAGEEPVGEQSKTTLFVANLPFSLDEPGLSKIFSDEGFTVNSVRVVRRRWGRPRKSKGYGFVDVGDEEQQKKALELLSLKEIDDGKQGTRQIAIKIAVNPAHDDSDEEKNAGGEAVEAAAA